MPEPRPSARRNSKPHGPATAAASVVLHPPERIDHTQRSAASLKPNHAIRRWSRFPVSPSAGGASRLDSRQKGPLPLQQPERFALALGDGQHIAPDATRPDGITGAAGRVATATAFTAARSARLRSRLALRLRSRGTGARRGVRLFTVRISVSTYPAPPRQGSSATRRAGSCAAPLALRAGSKPSAAGQDRARVRRRVASGAPPGNGKPALHVGQVRALQVGVTQVRVEQLCPGQVGSGQVRAG